MPTLYLRSSSYHASLQALSTLQEALPNQYLHQPRMKAVRPINDAVRPPKNSIRPLNTAARPASISGCPGQVSLPISFTAYHRCVVVRPLYVDSQLPLLDWPPDVCYLNKTGKSSFWPLISPSPTPSTNEPKRRQQGKHEHLQTLNHRGHRHPRFPPKALEGASLVTTARRFVKWVEGPRGAARQGAVSFRLVGRDTSFSCMPMRRTWRVLWTTRKRGRMVGIFVRSPGRK